MPAESYAIPLGEANVVRDGGDVLHNRARADGACGR